MCPRNVVVMLKLSYYDAWRYTQFFREGLYGCVAFFTISHKGCELRFRDQEVG